MGLGDGWVDFGVVQPESLLDSVRDPMQGAKKNCFFYKEAFQPQRLKAHQKNLFIKKINKDSSGSTSQKL